MSRHVTNHTNGSNVLLSAHENCARGRSWLYGPYVFHKHALSRYVQRTYVHLGCSKEDGMPIRKGRCILSKAMVLAPPSHSSRCVCDVYVCLEQLVSWLSGLIDTFFRKHSPQMMYFSLCLNYFIGIHSPCTPDHRKGTVSASTQCVHHAVHIK